MPIVNNELHCRMLAYTYSYMYVMLPKYMKNEQQQQQQEKRMISMFTVDCWRNTTIWIKEWQLAGFCIIAYFVSCSRNETHDTYNDDKDGKKSMDIINRHWQRERQRDRENAMRTRSIATASVLTNFFSFFAYDHRLSPCPSRLHFDVCRR